LKVFRDGKEFVLNEGDKDINGAVVKLTKIAGL